MFYPDGNLYRIQIVACEDGVNWTFTYILDRKKDMIISGGINIFASDIEAVLAGHPDVLDCTVIGVAHKKWGGNPGGPGGPHEGSGR